MQSVLAGKLKLFFEYNQETPGTFSYLGKSESYKNIINFLTKAKWTYKPFSLSKSSKKFLLCSLDDKNFNRFNYELNHGLVLNYILLRHSSNIKKTSILNFLEQHGFFMVFERQNTIFMSKHNQYEYHKPYSSSLENLKIKDDLKYSWRRIRHLPEKTKVQILTIPAWQLLQPIRFDIAIKIMYARLWRYGLAESWRNYAYYEHLLRITGPGADISEHDGTGKCGFENYQRIFHNLITAKKSSSIPIVPVDSSFIAFDGAHRIAAAIELNKTIKICKIDSTSINNASVRFFQASTEHPPISSNILDAAAIEYCRVKSGVVIALIFPNVVSEAFAIKELSTIGEICYQKHIVLSSSEGAELLRQTYLGHEWADKSAKDPGFLNKVKNCFPFKGILRVVMLDNLKVKDIRQIKSKIRNYYQLGNHSLHMTDSNDETLILARILFNTNSIKLLNHTQKISDKFSRLIFLYRAWLESNGLNEDLFCIDGGAILSLFGLRECNDIDFLYHGDQNHLPIMPKMIDCHNNQSIYFEHKIQDIIGDPNLHCWYMGVKFCIPKVVMDMKKNRAELKDKDDVLLFESLLKNESCLSVILFSSFMLKTRIILRLKIFTFVRHLKALLKSFIINFFITFIKK
jgi:hypothetical protein